ncbi:MAG: hypothetical protein E7213_09055 [Clostridium sp.]|nr:hypothetical protein [Clostridium sp.]
MRVYMERQSISMRDDRLAPNRREIEVVNNCRLRNFVDILMESYCPKNNKKRATWVLWNQHKVVAVFDSISKKCKCIQNSETFIKELSLEEDSAEMYLYYRGQEDMGEVIQEYEKQLIS